MAAPLKRTVGPFMGSVGAMGAKLGRARLWPRKTGALGREILQGPAVFRERAAEKRRPKDLLGIDQGIIKVADQEDALKFSHSGYASVLPLPPGPRPGWPASAPVPGLLYLASGGLLGGLGLGRLGSGSLGLLPAPAARGTGLIGLLIGLLFALLGGLLLDLGRIFLRGPILGRAAASAAAIAAGAAGLPLSSAGGSAASGEL